MNYSRIGRSTKNGQGFWQRCWLPTVMICIGLAATTVASVQSLPTATRLGDTQIGGIFVFGRSANTQVIPSTGLTLPGFGIYGVLDNREHIGFEGSFRQISNFGGSHIYERTYEVGPRYVLHYDRSSSIHMSSCSMDAAFTTILASWPTSRTTCIRLAVALMCGWPTHLLAYSFNVRLDYEYQTWMSLPRGDLHPDVMSVGVGYHFPQDCRTHICPK